MNEPSLSDIVEARNKCAEIIISHGEQFLPIFERLEKEIAILEEKQKTIQRVKQIVLQNGTQNGTHNGTQNHYKNIELEKIFNKNN